MVPNFLHMMEAINPQIQEMQYTPSTRSLKKTTPSHVIIRLFKICDKEETKSCQRNKDKNDSRFLIKNDAKGKTLDEYL